MSTVAAMTSPANREKQRERERRARERRADKVERMRHSVAQLQNTVLAIHTLGDDAWGRFLNNDAMRKRHVLSVMREAHRLRLEQAELQRMIKEHRVSLGAIATLLKDSPINDWSRRNAQWHELAQMHFTPWTLDACHEEMDAALKEVNAFQWSTDKHSTGLSFLGWRDQQRVDPVRSQYQFQFHKTFRGLELMDYVNVGWDTYTDDKTFRDVILGPRMLGSLKVLQQLTPNIMIVLVTELFPTVGGDIHSVYLVFRVRTERGFTQCVRSLCCPELMRAIDGPHDVWPSNFIWFQWETLEGDEHGYKFHIGGSMSGMDVAHLNQWLLECFGCVLRSERMATNQLVITSE